MKDRRLYDNVCAITGQRKLIFHIITFAPDHDYKIYSNGETEGFGENFTMCNYLQGEFFDKIEGLVYSFAPSC